ncbi:MAG: hypothetical protein P9M08_05015 [Candidatus Erginobacter occultus]|nr:hypothetical protein [Candidatus Erginobacter occultus]
MFSNRYRSVKILGILLLFPSLAWYSNRENRFLSFAECMRDPTRYQGAEVSNFLEPRILDVDDRRLLISQPDGPLEIRIPKGFDGVFPEGAEIAELKPGDSLEAVTVFRLPGYLELKAIRGAPLRRLKIVLSILPVLLVGFILLRTVRWRKGFLVILPDTSEASDKSDRSGNFKL